MASSRKSSRSKPDLAGRVAAQLEDIVKPSDRLVVALSGGVDSVVLLDVVARAARQLRCRVSALHVNHQLSPNARRWEAFCRRLCRARSIPFRSARVKVRRGDSIEAAARSARYAVFAREDCEFIVLAHHRDDQVETLLLQLLRGAGVKGLAAMPAVRKADGRRQKVEILRPFLDATREDILQYARTRKLRWIEDESNQDIYFHRNFLRHEVLPVIARRFPAYRTTLARAAGHFADAAQVLDETAARDAAGQLSGGSLAIAALRRLTPARARNLLRFFLAGQGVTLPNAERLEEALRQALTAKQDARVQVQMGEFEMRRFESRLHVVRALTQLPRNYVRRWRGEDEIALPELGGVLAMSLARGSGISLARLGGRPVVIRLRRGGERLQPDRRRPRRSLKNLLQEARIPPWERERLPLILCGEELVWAPGIGMDCRYQAAGAEPAVRPAWSVGGQVRESLI
jgi:tRNA(Ile)-lysidine synthase